MAGVRVTPASAYHTVAYIYIYMYIHVMYSSIYICMYVSMCVCVYIYTYIHTYIHIHPDTNSILELSNSVSTGAPRDDACPGLKLIVYQALSY